jgi:hypothetical protein
VGPLENRATASEGAGYNWAADIPRELCEKHATLSARVLVVARTSLSETEHRLQTLLSGHEELERRRLRLADLLDHVRTAFGEAAET